MIGPKLLFLLKMNRKVPIIINIIAQIKKNVEKTSGIPVELIQLTFLLNLKIIDGKAFIKIDDIKVLAIISIKFLEFI